MRKRSDYRVQLKKRRLVQCRGAGTKGKLLVGA